jgi:hypothetical protein
VTVLSGVNRKITMKLTRSSIASVAVLCTLGLVGGGAALVSPASASAGVNWGHIFKKQIKPRADKRYYTKKKANARFSVKSALLGYYTKAESDAKYAATGSSYTKAESDTNYYTKAQSDAKYAPFPSVIRGTYSAIGDTSAAGRFIGGSFSFGVTLAAAPTPHYIPLGGAVPAGCLGTPTAPDAAPGNLCIFERQNLNESNPTVFNPASGGVGSAAFGAAVYCTSTAAGYVFVYGSWAVRPLGGLSTSRVPATGHVSGALPGR